jgi:hypothetical protein
VQPLQQDGGGDERSGFGGQRQFRFLSSLFVGISVDRTGKINELKCADRRGRSIAKPME